MVINYSLTLRRLVNNLKDENINNVRTQNKGKSVLVVNTSADLGQR